MGGFLPYIVKIKKAPKFFGALNFIYCCVVWLLAQGLQTKDADFLPYSYILGETG